MMNTIMMNKDDLRPISMKALEYLRKDSNRKHYFLRTSSGTTGAAPLLTARHRRYLMAAIYEGSEAMVLFFGPMSTRLSSIGNFLFWEKTLPHARMMVVTADDLTDELDRLVGEFRADALAGFPSFIIRALLFMRDPVVLGRIKKLILSGEALNATHRAVISEKVPHARVVCYYASGETGTVATQLCSLLAPNAYHPVHNVTVEIAEPDGDGIGDILLTVPFSPEVKMERYRIGDVGRILPDACPCGDPMTLEVLGRRNFDFIKLAGGIIRQEIFDRAVGLFSDLVADYRGEVGEHVVGNRVIGKVVLHVVLADSAVPAAERTRIQALLEVRLSEHIFLTPTRTLATLVRSGHFAPLSVKVVEAFPPQYKHVKVRKVDTFSS